MRMGLQGVIRGKPVRTTIQDKAAPCPLDHVNRQFQAPSPEHALGVGLHLCRDMAGLRLRGLRHRRLCPPHRRLAGQPDGACGFVLDALEQALHERALSARAWCITRIAASQYLSASLHRALGRSRDRALRRQRRATAMTTRWPRRSTASTRPRSSIGAGPWRSFEAVEYATLEWVDWFNNRRLLEPIGNIPPAEAEERYYAMLESRHGRVTQNKRPPANPGRFN
jgi:putative transposase